MVNRATSTIQPFLPTLSAQRLLPQHCGFITHVGKEFHSSWRLEKVWQLKLTEILTLNIPIISSQWKQSRSPYPVQGRYARHFQRYCSKRTRHSYSTFWSRLPEVEFKDPWSSHSCDADGDGSHVQETLHRDEDPWSIWSPYPRCLAWWPFEFRSSRWAWRCLEGWDIAFWSIHLTEDFSIQIFTPILHWIDGLNGPRPRPAPYPYGSRGPKELDGFINKYGFRRNVDA